MRSYGSLRLLAVGAAALILEMTLLADVAWAGARPDLLVALVAFAALFAAEPSPALASAWALGLLRDLATAGPLGQYALIYLVLGWAVAGLRPVLFREHPFTQAAVGGIAAGIAGLASAACTSAFNGGVPLGMCLARSGSSALVTALLAPFLITLLARVRFLVR